MAHALVKARPASQPEYTVYIYHHPENQIEGQGDWEMRSVNYDLRTAISEADRLFKSRNFKKVEIKQRIRDPRTRSVTDQTLKIFEPGQHAARWSTWVFTASVLLLSLAITAALAVSFRP
jgi:hypothetical protein